MEKKRTVWGNLETNYMLSIIRDKKILAMLDGKRYRNGDIFHVVEDELKKRGFMKSEHQIRAKWKLLKSAYYKTERNNSVSGAERRECPFYSELHELLCNRPVGAIGADGVGVETLNIQAENAASLNTSTQFETEDSDNSQQLDGSQTMVNHSQYSDDISPSPSLASTSTPLQLHHEKSKSKDKNAYASALLSFSQDWKAAQEDLQNKFLEKQQEIIAEEMRKQREWEMTLLKKEHDASQRLMNDTMSNFFTNLSPLLRPGPIQHYSQFPFPGNYLFSPPQSSSEVLPDHGKEKDKNQ